MSQLQSIGGDPAICRQPHCPLRREGVGADELADAIVALLSGNDIPPVLQGGKIVPRDLCSECVRSIFESRGLPLTEDEAQEKVARASQRLERRSHRARRRG